MGEKDSLTKRFMSKPDVFADAFNYLIYNGEHVIDASDLTELDTVSIAVTYSKGGRQSRQTVQKARDILKEWVCMQDERATYMLLGVENQTNVHYAMPVRNMLYDAIQYENQVKKTEHKADGSAADASGEYLSGFGKGDRLRPVITLVIYFGEKKWDAPLSIYEMCGGIDECMRAFVADYRINLIEPATISVERLKKLPSDFQEAMLFIKHCADKPALVRLLNEDQRFQNLDRDTASMLRVVTGTKIKIREEEERINMCVAIQEMMDESLAKGRAEGREEGRAEGREEGRAKGREEGRAETIDIMVAVLRELGISEADILGQIKAKFGLSDEEITKYMKPTKA